MSTQFPAIPAVNTLPPELQRILGPVKEILEIGLGRRGNSSFLTVPTLSAQVQKSLDGGAISVPASTPTTTTPGTPTGLSASGALASVILSWTAPAYANHAYTEIWRSATNDLGAAVRVGSTPGEVYADDVGDTGVVYYYWIRFVSTSDTAGAYNAGTTGGTSATTSTVGTTNIANAAITNAKIGALAVDSANIAAAAIVEAKIGALAVTEAKIGAAAVTNAKIGALAVDTAQINSAAITTAKIGALAVDTANIATAAITTAKITDAAVDTLQLAGQAVTIPSSAYTSGATNVGSTAWVTVQTLTFTSTGAPVMIIAAAASTDCRLQLLENGASTDTYTSSNGTVVAPMTMPTSRTPGAGSVTYTLQAQKISSGGTTLVSRCFIVAIETKR